MSSSPQPGSPQSSDSSSKASKKISNPSSKGQDTCVSRESYELERKRAESLEELDRVKTRFFSNVSHEFRTPLTLMLGPLEDLVRRPADPAPSAETQEQLAVIYRNGLRLQKMVNALLDFSRIEAGRVQAVYAPTDLAQLTTDLASNFRAAIEKAGMKLRIDTSALKDPAYVDKEMWEKIVLNLVSNAFKYTLQGHIAVTLQQTTRNFVLKVEDTGIGIRDKDLPRLFERFHRIQSSEARTHEGTGIGLSLVHELVALHGGSVTVHSTYGKGTTFSITIPKGSSHLPAGQVSEQSSSLATLLDAHYVQEAEHWPVADTDSALRAGRSAASNSAEGARAHIVLADDNADMRDYVARLLQRYYDVTAVDDGQAALDVIKSKATDLVITDVMMHRLDGFGLLKAIRQDPSIALTPLIMLSAKAGEAAHINGLTAGADDYLVKPFGAGELLARVNTRLELARVLRQAAESEQRLRFMAESMPQKIFTVLPDGQMAYFNPQWETYTGIKIERLLKSTKARHGVVHPDDLASARESWRSSFMAGIPIEHEYRLRRNDGAYRWHISRVNPMRAANGTIEMWIGSATDIDDMKRSAESQRELEVKTALVAEQALQLEQLKQLNQAKDEFISLASHQLRTPATGVKQYIGMLLQGYVGDLTDDQTAFLQTAYESNERQITIVNDLLQVAQIDAGKVRLQKGQTDLVKLIGNIIDEQAVRFVERDQKVVYKPTMKKLMIRVDGDRIRMVLENIIDNAGKYTYHHKTITVRLRSTDTTVSIAVRDQGVGMAAADISKIFNKFARLDNPLSISSEGSGLGLYWAKKIIDLHQGTISVISTRGKGTTFKLTLPKKPTKPTPEAQGLS